MIKNSRNIKNENMIVGILGLSFRSFAIYCNDFDSNIFSSGQIKAYKEAMVFNNNEGTFFSCLGIHKKYQELKPYMIGINKRIGEINRFVNAKIIAEETTKKFNKELDNWFKKVNSVSEKLYINRFDADFISYIEVSIKIARELLKDIDLEINTIKYIKTYLTKLEKFMNNELDNYINDVKNELLIIKELQIKEFDRKRLEEIENFKKIKPRDEKIIYPTSKNGYIKKIINMLCIIEKLDKEKDKEIYNPLLEEYKSYKIDQLKEDYELTINCYKKRRYRNFRIFS